MRPRGWTNPLLCETCWFLKELMIKAISYPLARRTDAAEHRRDGFVESSLHRQSHSQSLVMTWDSHLWTPKNGIRVPKSLGLHLTSNRPTLSLTPQYCQNRFSVQLYHYGQTHKEKELDLEDCESADSRRNRPGGDQSLTGHPRRDEEDEFIECEDRIKGPKRRHLRLDATIISRTIFPVWAQEMEFEFGHEDKAKDSVLRL